MIELGYSVFGFIVAIGILIVVHEFGHFWVARMLGVKVLRFSIGFGKTLLTWHDKSGTEYAVSAIPLGGYVKMLDQHEGQVAPNELDQEFNSKPIWARILVIVAGPFFNILFAIFAYWLMFMIGISSMVPVLGDVPQGSVAAIAGLRSGQEIVAIDNASTPTWEDISVALVANVGEQDFINITTLDLSTKQESTHALNLSNWTLDNSDQNILLNLGIMPIDPMQPVVGKVLSGYPAEESGLEPGDLIVDVDGQPIASRSQLMRALHDRYDRATHMQVMRDGDLVDILITPTKLVLDGGDVTGYIGIQFEEQPWPSTMIRTQRFGPFESLSKAFHRTVDYSVLTLHFLKKMVVGQMSLEHIAGPISIAKFAGRTASFGIEYFLGFLALVSISLAILNMLPIPILDGGHLMYCIIEYVRGRPLSTQTLQVCTMFGYVFLGSLMILAVHNDFVRLLS